ncbi:MAG: nucleotidyltransferase family protein [Proteobacteria bacterium]|nr:nucleotidyltransferase family protein [Pseudomonadota bacterium]
MKRIVGILLAGGRSQRYGTANKLAACGPDRIAIGLKAAANLRSAVDELLVVVSVDETSSGALFNDHYEVTYCAESRNGIGHSIGHGVAARPTADGWLIALADMPYIQSATMIELAGLINSPLSIVRPRYEGRAGHPVGFGSSYFPELIALQGDLGAQSVINKHANFVAFLDTQDKGVVLDIDRPADLERPFEQRTDSS